MPGSTLQFFVSCLIGWLIRRQRRRFAIVVFLVSRAQLLVTTRKGLADTDCRWVLSKKDFQKMIVPTD